MTDIATVIELHTTFAPRAPFREPDMRPSWADQRQARFDRDGLPRGLKVVL